MLLLFFFVMLGIKAQAPKTTRRKMNARNLSYDHNWLAETAALMTRCGFTVRPWRSRLYLDGYGRDISAYVEMALEPGAAPLDGAMLTVVSNWRSRHNGLRCKGVKHAILSDLYRAELVSEAPPAHWRDVPLERAKETRPIVRALSELAD